MEPAMKTHQLMLTAFAASLIAAGGAGLAQAATMPSGAAVRLAATTGEDFNQGVGGNGSAAVRPGENYNGGVGGNGAAKVGTGEDYNSGVGGNGAAKSKTDPGQPGTAGVGSDARGQPAWKQQQ
jgi:hypothetical protein